MKTQKLSNGDSEIVYTADQLGRLAEKPVICCMFPNLNKKCKKIAFFIAKETKEPLCAQCYANNREARDKK